MKGNRNMSTQMKEEKNQLIFRHTNSRKGRNISITPQNSAMKHLVYGRIILDREQPKESFSTGPLEMGLICLSGECTIGADGQTNKIDRYDSIYIPRDTEVEITTETSVDLVECSAEVEKKYPLQVVRYADVEKDSSLKFKTGGASNSRTVNITLGKNVEAGRILTPRSSKSFMSTTTCPRPPLGFSSSIPIRTSRNSSA